MSDAALPIALQALGLGAGASQQITRGWDVRDLHDLRVSTIPEPMASPPTITRGASSAASSINGAASTAAAIQPSSSKLTLARGTWTPKPTFPTNFVSPTTIDYGAGTTGSNYASVRFATNAPMFDFELRESLGDWILWVDGQPITRSAGRPIANVIENRYHKVDFGTDALTWQVEGVSAISAAGSGYAVGDTITMSGGTGTAAQMFVANVGGSGNVTSALVLVPGNYSVVPSSPVSQASTSGSGTGFTFTPIWGSLNTTRRWRNIELLFRGGGFFGGINVPAGCTVMPWPVSGEKWLTYADSFGEAQFSGCPASTFDEIALQALGVWQDGNTISYGVGATGYVAKGAGNTRPNFLESVSDIVALNPTRLMVALGINDIASVSQVQANVEAAYTALLTDLPNCIFFCLGPWSGRSFNAGTATVSAAIRAGFEAVVPASRGVFIDVVADGLIQPDGTAAPGTPGAGNTGHITSSDNVHPSSSGQVHLGYGGAHGMVRGAKAILDAN